MAKKPSTAVIAGKSRGAGNKAASPVTQARVIGKNGGERSVEVRKIDNGYILRESVYSPRKGYTSTERYSPTAPTIEVEAPKGKK